MSMSDIPLTITGNLTADPETRQAGQTTVTSLRVAHGHRRFDRQAGQWGDDGTTFLTVEVWGEDGERVAATLRKGMAVVAVGTLKEDQWEDRQSGQKRSTMKLRAQAIGPDLFRCEVQGIRKVERQGGGSGGYGHSGGQGGRSGGGGGWNGGSSTGGGYGAQGGSQGSNDPWSGQGQWGGSGGGGDWGVGDEPPY